MSHALTVRQPPETSLVSRDGSSGCSSSMDSQAVVYVYEITTRHVQVRSEPREDARIDNYILHRGQLVAVDDIVMDNSNNHRPDQKLYSTGPFLRLADGTGWIFEHKAVGAGTVQQTICEPRSVMRQDWVFYIHPCRTVELRSHPHASSAVVVKTLDPLQRVACDAMIRHKDTEWYHVVRGTTAQGWVARQTISHVELDMEDDSISTLSGMHLDDDQGTESFNAEEQVLIPESCIQFGIFAYTVLQPVAVRTTPTVSEASRTTTTIQRGDICLATVVIHTTSTNSVPALGAPANGPFLYLPTLGWVFEHKKHNAIMQKLHVEEGTWTLQVVRRLQACCGPVLSASRPNHIQRYLMSEQDMNNSPPFYDGGRTLSSDVCVISPLNGATYYRVQMHPQHWLCKKNEQDGQLDVVRTLSAGEPLEQRQLEFSIKTPLRSNTAKRSTENSSTSSDGWTEDFVRGVASLIEGLTTEIGPAPGKLVYLKNKVRIQIECDARLVTVEATDGRPASFAPCSSKQLSSIFDDPLGATKETSKSHQLKPPPPVRFSGNLSLTTTKSKNVSGTSIKDTLHSQLSEVEQQLAHHAARKRELQEAIARLENGNESCPNRAVPGDVSASVKISTSLLLGMTDDEHVGSFVSTGGSRTASYGSTASADSSETYLLPNTASEVNLVCGACYEQFTYPRERRKHCLEVHGLYSCNFCTAVFDTQKKLHAHRDDRDHW